MKYWEGFEKHALGFVCNIVVVYVSKHVWRQHVSYLDEEVIVALLFELGVEAGVHFVAGGLLCLQSPREKRGRGRHGKRHGQRRGVSVLLNQSARANLRALNGRKGRTSMNFGPKRTVRH